MKTTVLGLFDEVEDARRVLAQLVGSPLDLSTVQVVHADPQVQRDLAADAGLPSRHTVLTGVIAGAVLGGILGAFASQHPDILAALGALLTLGAGVLVGGAIGAGAGAVAGRLRLPEDQDKAVLEAIEDGCTAVIVHTNNLPTARAIRDLFAAGGSRLVGQPAAPLQPVAAPSSPSSSPANSAPGPMLDETNAPEDSRFIPPWRRSQAQD